jgi:hypothetical protein
VAKCLKGKREKKENGRRRKTGEEGKREKKENGRTKKKNVSKKGRNE